MKSIPFSPCHERLLPFPSYYVAGTYALFADLDGVKGLLATSFLSPAARLLANVPSRWGHTHVLPFFTVSFLPFCMGSAGSAISVSLFTLLFDLTF